MQSDDLQSPFSASKVTHVAVAVIRDHQGRVLIARRPDHLHQGGLWEFPGGKVEAGEDIQKALRREIAEEVSLEIQQARPLIGLHHRYPDKSVYLDVWLVEAFAGEAHGREGQPVKWVSPEALGEYRFPDANRAIVNCLRLPDRYLITGPAGDNAERLKKLEGALAQGIRLVQLRAPQLDASDFRQWALQAIEVCHRNTATCLLNSDPVLAIDLEADGVHLNSRRLMAATGRPLHESKWVGASVHNQNELVHAQRIGADFVVIGAVQATASHPEVAPLGWDGFSAMIRQANIPCYALGGLGEVDIDRAKRAGAQGVAAIRAWWPV